MSLKVATSLCAIVLVLNGLTVYAHDGVEHATAIEAETHEELTLTQMEAIITLLQKIIVLLKEKQAMQQTVPVVPVEVAASHEEMEEHHEEHSTTPIDAAPVPVLKLIIEVEAHNDKTHVHVRYVDKPEAMFFVDSAMSDEEGVVADIVSATGLGANEVREAIVHLGM